MNKHRFYIVGAALAALGMVGCSDRKSELERQRELVNEVLQERKVDFTTPIVATAEHKFSDEAELTAICDEFMSHFGKGEMDRAFDLLDKHTPWPQVEKTALREQTKKQIQTFSARFGKFCGHEKMKVQEIGGSLVRFQYLAKLENMPLRCIFMFYRTTDKWTLILFVWDDKVYLMDP